jgi:hypothetical protein
MKPPRKQSKGKKGKNRGKVQCIACRWFVTQKRTFFSYNQSKCIHPLNKKEVVEYDRSYTTNAWYPWKQNENCDCRYWDQKLSGFDERNSKVGGLIHAEVEG